MFARSVTDISSNFRFRGGDELGSSCVRNWTDCANKE